MTSSPAVVERFADLQFALAVGGFAVGQAHSADGVSRVGSFADGQHRGQRQTGAGRFCTGQEATDAADRAVRVGSFAD